jgi:hypothetical protein
MAFLSVDGLLVTKPRVFSRNWRWREVCFTNSATALETAVIGDYMLKNSARFWLLAPAALLVWFDSTPAIAAPLSACGEIELGGDAQCEVQIEGGCDILCDTSNLTLACSGELYADCRSDGCNVDLDVECTGSCTADCTAECAVDPGDFSCEGSCNASCEGNCDAECSASNNKAECKASCDATCGGECSASCSGTPPEVNCEAKCEASCEGQCKAEANVDCQVDCQADAYVECKGDMQIECEAQCKRPEGVVICDGQFIDANKVSDCVAAIEAALGIEVEVYGSADGDCSGNECSASAEGGVSCAVAPAENRGTGSSTGLVVGSALIGLVLARRRRRAS